MKKIEIIKIQIFLAIVVILFGILTCFIIGTVERMLEKINPICIMIAICLMIYRILRKEN